MRACRQHTSRVTIMQMTQTRKQSDGPGSWVLGHFPTWFPTWSASDRQIVPPCILPSRTTAPFNCLQYASVLEEKWSLHLFELSLFFTEWGYGDMGIPSLKKSLKTKHTHTHGSFPSLVFFDRDPLLLQYELRASRDLKHSQVYSSVQYLSNGSARLYLDNRNIKN